MPNAERLLRTLHRATEAFRHTPGRQGHFLQLQDTDGLLVAGDLHGQIDNFKRILEVADLAKHPRRHLVFQEVIHGPYRYLATGGDQSHRLLDLVSALKCQYPERTHMLLGNHELSQWTNRSIKKGDEDLNQLFRLGVETAYGSHVDEVCAAYDDMFAVLPVAIRTPNRVFLSHSLPGASRLHHWELRSLCREQYEPDDLKITGCVHAIVWGRDTAAGTTMAYLQKVDADWLITGHIPCSTGFLVASERHLILDTKDEEGCCCLFPTKRPVDLQTLLEGILRLQPKPLGMTE